MNSASNNFTRKLKKLFTGKTPLKSRILPAFLSAFALSFTLFFFGPLDLTYLSRNYVNCTVTELFPFCLMFWAVTLLCLAVPSALIGGKIHSFLVSVFCGLALGFYIQGNYLNIDLGVLDGNVIPWQNYGDNALVNYLIWFFILLIPFMLHYFSGKIWRNFVILTSLALILMQGVSIGIKLYDQYRADKAASSEASDQYALSMADQYIFSPEKNVVVFLMDATSEDEIRKALQMYPEMLAPFHDFTCFDNMNTNYLGTFPALTYLLTGTGYDFEQEGYREYFERAWHSDAADSFYSGLSDNGWKTNLYVDTRHAAFAAKNMLGKVSNVVQIDRSHVRIDRRAFLKLIKLSLYRYLPLGMKAPFWIYTDDISGLKQTSSDYLPFDSSGSAEQFWKNGLRAEGEENLFTVYHYEGAHPPYLLNSDGRVKSNNTRQEDQIAGYFHTVAEITQYMKDLEIYDSSTIIISADHGAFQISPFNPQAIFYIKRPSERHAEMIYSHAMVSQDNFLPTIAEAAGLDPSEYGKTVFEISDDEQIERCMFWRGNDPAFPNPQLRFNVMREYCYVGDAETLIDKISSHDYSTHPMVDTFY